MDYDALSDDELAAEWHRLARATLDLFQPVEEETFEGEMSRLAHALIRSLIQFGNVEMDEAIATVGRWFAATQRASLHFPFDRDRLLNIVQGYVEGRRVDQQTRSGRMEGALEWAALVDRNMVEAKSIERWLGRVRAWLRTKDGCAWQASLVMHYDTQKLSVSHPDEVYLLRRLPSERGRPAKLLHVSDITEA